MSCVQWWPCTTKSADLNARLFLDSNFCGQCTNGIEALCCILNLDPRFSSPSCTVCAESICSALTEIVGLSGAAGFFVMCRYTYYAQYGLSVWMSWGDDSVEYSVLLQSFLLHTCTPYVGVLWTERWRLERCTRLERRRRLGKRFLCNKHLKSVCFKKKTPVVHEK